MKLWLDDIRPAPNGWTHVKTVEEAKKLLESGGVEYASLDHDLGEYEPTGSDLVVWMAMCDVWPKNKPVVHSMNPVGANYMRGVIDRYWR